MAEKWDTVKRCERCLLFDQDIYCKGQKWGMTIEGCPEFLITCENCGWSVVYGYDFRSGSEGRT